MNMFNDSGFDKLFINPVLFKPLLGNAEAAAVESGIPVSSTQALPTNPAVAAVPSAPSPSATQVAKQAAPISSRLPAPPKNSSGNTWKWVLTIVLLAGGVYLFNRYQKKKQEEKK